MRGDISRTNKGFSVPSGARGVHTLDQVLSNDHALGHLDCKCRAHQKKPRSLCSRKLAIIFSEFSGPSIAHILVSYTRPVVDPARCDLSNDSVNRMSGAPGSSARKRAAAISAKRGPGPDHGGYSAPSTRGSKPAAARNTHAPPPPPADTLDKLRKVMEKKSRIVDEKAQVFSEAMELQRLRARQATSPDAVDEVADTAVADSTRALQRAQRALVKAKGLYSNAQELQRLRYTHGIRSYSIISHHITSHHSTLHHSITCTQQITSHHITSHYIASHLITSHPITSHLSTSQHTPSKHDSGLDGGDSTDSSKGTSPSTPKAVPKRKGMSARAMSAGLYVMTPSNRSNAAKCYNCRKILSEQNCKLRVVHCSPWVDSTTGRTSPGNTNRTSFCLFGKGKKISTNCFNRLQRVPLRMDELSDEHGLTDEEQAELQKIAEGWNEIRPAAAPKRRRGAC